MDQAAEVTQTAAPEATVSTSTVEAAPANNTLTIQDLQTVAQIIEVATQRGTFKANELVNVGTVYNKLTTFLSGIKAAAEAAEAPKA